MTALVLAIAATAVALACAGVFVVPRRPVLAAVLIAVGTATLVAGDLVPRHLATREVDNDCLTATIAPPPSPLVWQAVSGGVVLEARVASDTVVTMVGNRLADTPLAGGAVELVEQAVEVEGDVESPFGLLPVTAELRPSVEEGRLAWELQTLRVGDRELPAALRERLLGGRAAQVPTNDCGGDAGPMGTGTVRSASVDPSGLVLRVSV